MSSSNVSTDLIWEVCRTSNSFLVKRKTAGGVQLSSDPLNLMNKHSRKYDGFVNEKAIGIQPGTHGGVKVLTINKKKRTQLHEVDLHPKKSARKVYRTMANVTAKGGYRADLRPEAVARSSAILRSQRKVKDVSDKKKKALEAMAKAKARVRGGKGGGAKVAEEKTKS